MQKIKVAVAGLGFIGPVHVESLRRLPNIEVIAATHIDPQGGVAKTRQLGIERFYDDFETLLLDDDIDCVHICTPNHLHYTMAKAALLAGKHVVCEKPLANTLEEAKALTELAAKVGKVNAIHFNVRYYPLVRQMRIMREKGELGDVFSVIGTYLQDWLFYQTDYNWRLEPEVSGDSRAIADIGSHLMDLLEYITGLQIISVMADFNTVHKTRKKPLKPIETYSGKILKPEDFQEVPVNTEDFATVLLKFDNGHSGVITVSQVAAGRKNRINLEISGSKKSFSWCSEKPESLWIGHRDAPNQELMRDPSLFYPGSASLISYPGGHAEGFGDTSKQLFKEVYAAIADGKTAEQPLFPTFKDGFREQMLCESIIESNKKQSWIHITN
ncbi:MAG: Gfo/Idh/MocA family oxidoreductase [Cyclobacteriaceae bacterium]|nr:Gfo/Idh/MocA family oxidoreductase [Cyclobacteriaceae bacterium]